MASELGVDAVDGTEAINWVALKGHGRSDALKPIFTDGIWSVMRADYPDKLPICTIDRGDDHHDATRENAEQVAAFIARACSSHYDMLNALKRVMAMLDSGTLVRNISNDASAGWPMKMLEFVQDLNRIQSAISKAEGK